MIPDIKKILYATDLSENAHYTFGYAQPGCPFIIDDIIVVTGHPVDRIIRQAEDLNADLIVMGSHGRGGLADVTLGSTSRRILRRCNKPVLVVRLPENKIT